jgi:hypothetical protein
VKAADVIETLTGYDELALEAVAGKPFEALGPSLLVRAMAAVLMSRADERLTIQGAYQTTLGMKQTELEAWWAQQEAAEDEVFEDEPVTDEGKDDSGPVSVPTSGPSSTSTPV